MPRVVVVLDIDAYAKDPRRLPYKGLIEKGEFELGGSCPQCGKDFLDVGEVVYGKPMLPDGAEWFNSGKSFLDGGTFTYENKPLEWLFDNYPLWNREDTVAVCSQQCAELRELRFRQTQAEAELKNLPLDEQRGAESVVFHGSETPSSRPPLSVDPSSPSKRSMDGPSFPAPPPPASAGPSAVPLSPVVPSSPCPPPPSPLPSSPQNATPTAFKKGGRAPPPPPPVRSPSALDHDIKNVTEGVNPPTPSSNHVFEPSVSSPSSSAPSSLENPFVYAPVSPPTISQKTENSESKGTGVAWCLEELSKLQVTLVEASRRVGELTSMLESLRREGQAHPPPPLPPLPEEDQVKHFPSPPPQTFTALSEADDVN